MKYITTFLFVTLALFGCKEIYEPPPQSLVEATVFSSSTRKSLSSVIAIKGVENDSIWMYPNTTTGFRLPLSDQEKSSFVIVFDTIYVDTLTIYHDTNIAYESMETGFYTEHWINKLENTWNRIDSVSVVDSTVNQLWHENIQLYISNLPAVAN